MAHAISEKAKMILDYVKSVGDENVTAAKIAEELDMEVKSVNPCITSGLQKKGLVVRVPAQVEVEDEDGNSKYVNVKFIKLTDEGVAYDHEEALALDAEEKAAKLAEKEAAKAAKAE